jgi:hypothetical protein
MAVLASILAQLGSDTFWAQYQQAPVPPGGAMIKRAWVRRYEQLPTIRGLLFATEASADRCPGEPGRFKCILEPRPC